MPDEFIERRIIIGLIVSDSFIERIYKNWNSDLLISPTARMLARWSIKHYKKYHKAPGRDIEGIFAHHLKKGLSQERGEDIENILESLDDEYTHTTFNVEYLLDQTRDYFKERHLRNLSGSIQNELDGGNIIEAEQLASTYQSFTTDKDDRLSIDPFTKKAKPVIEQAFAERAKPLIKFPKAFGEFINYELVRGGFVAFMGPEKSGKTFMLMETSIRGVRNGCNVVFFQAGDMTERQQIRRLGIYLTQRSDQERYCKELLVPQVDCIYNQTDECDSDMREGNSGIDIDSQKEIRELTYNNLSEKLEEFPDHEVCYNCQKHKGAIWFRKRELVNPINGKIAYKAFRKFERRYKARFRLSSFPNETLSNSQMESLLTVWEKRDGFIADVITVDFGDIMASDSDTIRLDFRNQQNKIWQRLRRLSEERHCLVITATLAAASSYGKDWLSMIDFSEDKRKYAHVTAMYGLNQTDREKRIGIMRINELVVREAFFDRKRHVTILQRLEMGRPFLGSY